ncbi:MAG: hypothetical protein LLG44_13735 [Chloroflexi bacterium]|nr:hypothetical protein [Chloroflexota bacterium]
MLYKPDWSEAQRRLTALWHGALCERPCIQVTAPLPDVNLPPAPEPADDEARWLDPAYLAAAARRSIAGTWWGGEAIPSMLLQGGWVNCLGGRPHFTPETIWFEQRSVDFNQPSAFRHDPSSPWTREYRAALEALCAAAGWDDFLVGSPGGLPANDLLAQQMGVEAFMLALLDQPAWMERAITQGARDQIAAKHEYQALIRQRHAFWYGNAGWMPFWAPEPYNTTQSDVSCMLSPAMYERFVVPELDIVGADHGALWYHLDGGDARQHLPRLLTLPYLRVVQYTPAPCEPPNGPEHLEMYRMIQAAGRIIHIDLPAENVEPLVRELNPALLLLQTHCASREEGERLLEASRGWV